MCINKITLSHNLRFVFVIIQTGRSPAPENRRLMCSHWFKQCRIYKPHVPFALLSNVVNKMHALPCDVMWWHVICNCETCVLGRAEIAQIKKFTQIEANIENNCLLLIQFGMVDGETHRNGNGKREQQINWCLTAERQRRMRLQKRRWILSNAKKR